MSKLSVVNPVAEAQIDEPDAARFTPASRARNLEGKTVGLFWNGKPHGDLGLARTRQQLERLYGGLRFIDVFGEKGGLNRYASEAQLELMARECDVVVGATAD